jgi:hypothetical protein
MPTYFCFSDECGLYLKHNKERQLRTHPYYIRSCLIIDSSEWKKLDTLFRDLKTQYSFPVDKEIKWSYAWQLFVLKKYSKEIPKENDLFFLKDIEIDTIYNFMSDALKLLNALSYKKVILTYTDNSLRNGCNEKTMLLFHLQEIMQRIEMEIQGEENNIAVLFIDPINEKKDDLFRGKYFDLFSTGDVIKEYKHIKDSLNIEYSHHSSGIQMADYICGAFSAILKCRDINKGNYSNGISMFLNSVYPNLRSSKGNIFGFGIREVMSNDSVRDSLNKKIDELKSKYMS